MLSRSLGTSMVTPAWRQGRNPDLKVVLPITDVIVCIEVIICMSLFDVIICIICIYSL